MPSYYHFPELEFRSPSCARAERAKAEAKAHLKAERRAAKAARDRSRRAAQSPASMKVEVPLGGGSFHAPGHGRVP
eukprot:CAMPEP_0206057774 /NCGR_PEP_ID=MMETSP1466-20131121/45096_1 /ASSEMBLY_ACC=CAM_ASM_001126 /TAXON_ID=44452 /ORGANISM="Pavlova gyrans, Strain CCMP608" /LENGTH=75 /DNA_ID=CAMNT_0053433055 /DNA_START=12 /DNA_END=235 /DNA_ORIENTATION=+